MQTDHIAESATKKSAAKPTVRAKKTAKPKAAKVATTDPSPSHDELAARIATAAYYQAERRGFAPGHELEDWLVAERQVTSQTMA